MQPFKYKPKLNNGDLRNKIHIQEFIDSTDEDGYPVQDWVTVHSLWSKIKTVKGSEAIDASKEINTLTYRFIVRYTKGLHAKQRILFNGELYDIQSILNDDELQQTLTIVAVSTGEKVIP